MSSEHLLQPLNQLLSKARALLVLTTAEEWEQLQIPFEEYQQQMTLLGDAHFLMALKNAHLNAEAQALILQIQIVNQQLDEFAEQSHANIASELRQLIQADKALDAYGR